VTREIVEAGDEAAAIPVDTRDYDSIEALVSKTVELHGRLDVLVYNSGAIWWASVQDTPMKRFQLMQRVNVEGLYGVIQAALPQFKRQRYGRIIVVSPPIYSRFFRGKTAYAMGKVGMSVLTKGLAMDLQREGLTDVAITSIWPAAAIESGATKKMTEANPDEARDLRKASIFSDAILAMLKAPAESVNGRLELDEDFLRTDAGVSDFSKYSLIPGSTPRRIMPQRLPDLTVAEQDDEGKRMNSAKDMAKL
jgi:NAD(P)-dependent dehydrogenase (short-subunit alcohol dehydrogenase family)